VRASKRSEAYITPPS